MATEYFNPSYWKAKAHVKTAPKSERPVLSEEDELFLNSLTDEHPPPLPPRRNVMDLPEAGDTRGNDAQLVLMDGAQNVPLPETPNETSGEPTDMAAESAASRRTRKAWSWLRRDSRDSKRRTTSEERKEKLEEPKPAEAQPNEDGLVDDHEARKEEEDMAVILDRLNLAAVNNRVFSISDETQQLLSNFNLIFKDLIKGVPTAYDDLEKLLTNADKELSKTFNSLPQFLQKLVQQLPDKMTKGIAPTILSAAAERADKSGVNMANAGKAAGTAKRMGFRTPSLKDLIGKPGAIATMMRSIIAFLRARFPAFMGMNVLWSLALFVLLLLFWYCHKRGREVRLEKEGALADEEVARLEREYAEESKADYEREDLHADQQGSELSR